ncbi:hypothetical protein RJ639_001168 [Escallonia herrerae]|uniref:Transposase (putative) gypsy type domain-containing protein n=1 Tax=Escallonia herrerae TaxID=1293975 RepID=A0AA88XIA0_9ASTE|nr:hypothetical protein RJ639_001168 [Escallonia herrerae]
MVWMLGGFDRVFGRNSVRTEFCSAVVTLLGQSVRTGFCSARILLGLSHSARAECSDEILFGQNSARLLSLCSGRAVGRDSVQTKFCSALVTLLGQSVRTGFCLARILLGRGHSARAQCSDEILFSQNSARTGFCSDGILLSRCHSARAECSDGIMFGQNFARTGFCLDRILLGQSVRTGNSVWPEFCSAVVTLLGQSVRRGFCSNRILLGLSHFARTEFCSARILLGRDHSARAQCSDTILGQNRVRPFGTLLGQSVRTKFCLARILLGQSARFMSTSFQVFVVCLEDMSESSVSVSSPEEGVVISSSSSSRSEPLRPSSSQPPQPLTSQPSSSLPAKNALGDVKDQAEDEANPKPWYTVDGKSSKMSIEDLVELLREYPLPVGWYARPPGLQEPANYGTKYETGIYKEQVRSGYRLPLHLFALRFFEHYHMAPGQLVPNGWRKLVGLIYLVQTSGYKPDATDFMRVFSEICFVKGVANCPGCHIKLRGGLSIDEPLSEQQLEWARIIPRMPASAGAVTPHPAPTISSTFPAESASLEMASGSGKTPQGGFLGALQKAKGKRKEKQPSAELPPAPNKARVIPPDHSPQIVEKVFVEEDLIFRPRWTLRSNDMYMSGSEMPSRFEMARQVAAEEAQQKREALKEAEEATRHAEELSKQETDYLAQIETLERRLERAKRRVAEEVKKARDQGIRDFLDGNAGDEWLKKRANDGLEIYELSFVKAKEMFAERFPVIPLDDFVLPAVISPSGETVLPSEVGDAAAFHLPGEGPFGDAPKP